MMGVVATISATTFPKQGSHAGRRVLVVFHYDLSRKLPGVVLRDDAEDPYETIISLDDGRVVRGVECQYQVEPK